MRLPLLLALLAIPALVPAPPGPQSDQRIGNFAVLRQGTAIQLVAIGGGGTIFDMPTGNRARITQNSSSIELAAPLAELPRLGPWLKDVMEGKTVEKSLDFKVANRSRQVMLGTSVQDATVEQIILPGMQGPGSFGYENSLINIYLGSADLDLKPLDERLPEIPNDQVGERGVELDISVNGRSLGENLWGASPMQIGFGRTSGGGRERVNTAVENFTLYVVGSGIETMNAVLADQMKGKSESTITYTIRERGSSTTMLTVDLKQVTVTERAWQLMDGEPAQAVFNLSSQQVEIGLGEGTSGRRKGRR